MRFSSLIPTVALGLASCAQSLVIGDSMLNTFQELIAIDTAVITNTPLTNIAENSELLSLHKNLIQISSISGNETSVASFLKGYLISKGLTVELLELEDGRQNVFAYLGSTKDCSLLLTSHIDTVPPYIEYSRDGDMIYGRGSNDAKASVAAQISSFFELLAAGEVKEGDIALLYVIDEEVGGNGMRAASKELEAQGVNNWSTVIFGEPTENKLAVGHKGIYYFAVKVSGKASHSGYPEMGVNANYILIDIMHDLQHLNYPVDELLGPTTLNIGLLHGGVANNVISPEGEFSAVIRSSVNASIIADMISEVVDKYSESYDVEFSMVEYADPSFCDYEVDGFETYIAAYSTDIPNLKNTGYKRYLYGPGSILVAHSANEYVTLQSLEQALADYKKLIKFSL